jgi:hypothetical protein
MAGTIDLLAGGDITTSGVLTGSTTISATANGALSVAGSITSGTGTTLTGLNVTQTGGTISGILNATATSGDVSLSQAGGYTLGLLSAPGSVSVSSGAAIVDGNAGPNLSASSAFLSAGSGIGTIADPLETAVGQLSASSSAGEIGIINTGNLTLSGLFLGGAGSAAVGATGAMVLPNLSSVSVGGNVSLIANGLTVGGGVFAVGNVVLNGQTGILDITSDGGEGVFGSDIFLLGANISIGSPSAFGSKFVDASGILSLSTPGNLTVRGGSGAGASTIVTGGAGVDAVVGGNVVVAGGSGSGADAVILGIPDVTMSVGGTVQLVGDTSSGSAARIEAGSPLTIHLTFPLLATDGFSVNGVVNAIVDDTSNPVSGFFVEGSAAVLGQNLFVSYGGAPPPPIETLPPLIPPEVVDPPQPPAEVTSGSAGSTQDEEEKKKLPFCAA